MMSEKRDRLDELRIDRTPETARRPWGALVLIALLLTLAAAAGYWFFGRGGVVEVRTATVAEIRGADDPAAGAVLDASGYVTARRRATVSAQRTGKIVEVLVDEGLEVTKDQVLARLDDTLARREVALAEAQLASSKRSLAETEVRLAEAKLTLERTHELVAANVSSQAALDRDKAAYDALAARLASGREEVSVAASSLAVRQQTLDEMVIRAPFDGVVVTKNAQPGEMISPTSAGGGFTRTGICTVVDMGSLEIEVDVNEAYINRVEPGQRVVATLDAYPEWKIPATVITTVPTADRQRATVAVRIAFDALDPRILPEMGIKVSFLAAAEEAPADDADRSGPRLTVPSAAVRDDGGQAIVFVVAASRAERRAVRAGARAGERVEIEAGLRAGEQVVIEGPADLADGAAVEVVTQ